MIDDISQEKTKTVIEKRWRKLSDKWFTVAKAIGEDRSSIAIGYSLSQFEIELKGFRDCLNNTVLATGTPGYRQMHLDEELHRLESS